MKSLGLISLIFFGAAVSYMFVKWPVDTTKTFSQNAARYRASAIYYGVVWEVAVILLSLFAYGWFIPTLQLPAAFSIVFGIGLAGQVIAALVPETDGWRKVTHLAAAGVMYLSTFIFVSMLIFSPSTPSTARIVSIFALAIMVATFLSAWLFKSARRYPVALQTIHMICFFGVLLTITYLL